MTDVYKSRSRDVFLESLKDRKDIILETPFNNESFKDFADLARDSGYQSSLVILFLNKPTESFERVAARATFENGLAIPEEEVRYNFAENFKNVAKYFLYFDNSYFIYTGIKDLNQHIMTFERGRLLEYKANDLDYIQRFAGYAYSLDRIDKRDLDIITANNLYKSEKLAQRQVPKMRLRR